MSLHVLVPRNPVTASTFPVVPSTEPVADPDVDPMEKILDEFSFTMRMPKSTPEERAARLAHYNNFPWMHPGYAPSPSPEPIPPPEPTRLQTPPPPSASTSTSTTPTDARGNLDSGTATTRNSHDANMHLDDHVLRPTPPPDPHHPPTSRSSILVPHDHPSLDNPHPIYSFAKCTSAREKEFYEAIFPYLQHTGLGPLFGALTSRLYIYEEFCGFAPCGETLGGTDQRHPEIGRWIKSRRPTTFTPMFVLPDFEECWWDWWCAIQPEDRRIEGNRPCFEEKNSIDWESLNVWGLNGIVLIVVALSWWGWALNIGGTPRESTSWPDAVRDVVWVLWELEVMLSLKRDLGDMDEEGDGEEETIVTPLSPRRGKRKATDDDSEKAVLKRTRRTRSENENTTPSHPPTSPRRTRSRRG
ncbi:uncharacterized protein STEHIDRAFT_164091 [Stereum hirsutum FP-91666 SS1]|uniref:Uncharacterized protein n=1 Tax=Stereum hirsutum (strain FP-91666) TaxID=721885 RepID=R7RVG9_STEHR|nr:uncharacterized protein STEHIDRAFT_164091 [Stereum hirsutum FP-91666 SS1]EIM79021.1 hypothetical protein STEHIDRAFT_164091 [Stereum hirsutum FP-91666 SS1]